MFSINLKKNFLYAFVVSIVFSALLGIFATITGTLTENGKILLTAMTVTAASFSLFLNGIFFERMFGKVLPLIGFVLTAVAAFLSIVTIWGSTDFRPFFTVIILLFANFCLFPFGFYYEERRSYLLPLAGAVATVGANLFAIAFIWHDFLLTIYYKHFITLTIIGIACFYLSLVLLVPLAKRYSWSILAVQVAVWTLATTLIGLVITEPKDNWLTDVFLLRFTVILAIIVAALTVLIPIFYRLSLTELTPPEKLSLKEIEERIAHFKKQIQSLEDLKRDIVQSSDETLS